MQNQLFEFSRGAGIPNFPSMTEVKRLKFICPDLKDQKEFVKQIEKVSEIKKAYIEDIRDFKQIINKKMTEIFSGESTYK